MAVNNNNKTDLNDNNDTSSIQSKEDRIQAELNRISVHYASMDSNIKSMVTPLLQNAAFMKVTLDDLQEEIKKNGVVEVYQNGQHQHGLKQSSALQSYNALIKNYAAINKTLSQMMPPEEKEMLYDSTMIRGDSVWHWKWRMKEEAEENPEIYFMSFKDWMANKLREMDAEEEDEEDEE